MTLEQPVMVDRGRSPRLMAPPGACETHSHIYGPAEVYPQRPMRTPNLRAELPTFLTMLRRLRFERAVIVQPSLYGFDNRATLDAVAQMGRERARGVAVCPSTVTHKQLRAFHERGIRGLRFFLLVDDLGLGDMPDAAVKCADLGWHLVVQGRDEWLDEALPVLRRLPCPVVIDHLARTPPGAGVRHHGFQQLLRWMEGGQCWVKISAPYLSSEVGPPGYDDVETRVRALVETRPDRLLWAANWPHPNSPIDNKPDEADCLDVLLDWVDDEYVRQMILCHNPSALYGFNDN